VIRYEWQG